jgi:hypothetical protein
MYPDEDKVREACARVGLACQTVGLYPDYYITDEVSGDRIGGGKRRRPLTADEVMQLVDKRETDHRWKAARLLHLCRELLNPRERDFLQSVSVQRYALSVKQERWFADIQAGMERAAQAAARRQAADRREAAERRREAAERRWT